MSLFRGRRSRIDASSKPLVHDLDVAGSNPLLVAFTARPSPLAEEMEVLTARFAFAIPTDAALRVIARHSPSGVVEVGAGTGYWASLLLELGVDVVAYDPAPPGSAGNKWFHSSDAWYPVADGDESVVERHADRTLLLVWPTRDEVWAADAVRRFHAAGGQTVAYVGEGVGGRTGDLSFHRLLGEVDQCLACTWGVVDSACVCGIDPLWQRIETVALPHWPGQHDDLHVYRALPARVVL
jgi:hypothetical protein